MSNVQDKLNTAFPGAVAGDAVLDQASGYYWQYDGSIWVQKIQGLDWEILEIGESIEPYEYIDVIPLGISIGYSLFANDWDRNLALTTEINFGVFIGGNVIIPTIVDLGPSAQQSLVTVFTIPPVIATGIAVKVLDTPEIEIVAFEPLVEGGSDKVLELIEQEIVIDLVAQEPSITVPATTVNADFKTININEQEPFILAINDPFYNDVNFILGDGGELLNTDLPKGRVYLDGSENLYKVYQLNYIDEFCNFVDGKEYFTNHRPLGLADETTVFKNVDVTDPESYQIEEPGSDWDFVSREITVFEEALDLDFNEYVGGELGVRYNSSVKNHGNGSYSFAGKSTWLEWIANDADKYGSGDFTLEWWQFLLPDEVNRSGAGYSHGVTYENHITFTQNAAVTSNHNKRFDWYHPYGIGFDVREDFHYGRNDPRYGYRAFGRSQNFLAEPGSDTIRLSYSTDAKYIPDYNLNLIPGNTLDFFVDGIPVTATVSAYTQLDTQPWGVETRLSDEEVTVEGDWTTTLISFSDYTFPSNYAVHEIRFSLQQNGFSAISLAEDERYKERHVCNLAKFNNNKLFLNRKGNNEQTVTINGDSFYEYVSFVLLHNQFTGNYSNQPAGTRYYEYSPFSETLGTDSYTLNNEDASGLQPYGKNGNAYDPSGYFDIRAYSPVASTTVGTDEYSTTVHKIYKFPSGTDAAATNQDDFLQDFSNNDYLYWSQDLVNWKLAKISNTTAIDSTTVTFNLTNGWALDSSTDKTLYVRRFYATGSSSINLSQGSSAYKGSPLIDTRNFPNEVDAELVKQIAPKVFFEDFCVEFYVHPLPMVYDDGSTNEPHRAVRLDSAPTYFSNDYLARRRGTPEVFFQFDSYPFREEWTSGLFGEPYANFAWIRCEGSYEATTNSKGLTEVNYSIALTIWDPDLDLDSTTSQPNDDAYWITRARVVAYEGASYEISDTNPVQIQPEDDRWFHIAVTCEGNIFTIYVNGVPKAHLNPFSNQDQPEYQDELDQIFSGYNKQEVFRSIRLWDGSTNGQDPNSDTGHNVEHMAIFPSTYTYPEIDRFGKEEWTENFLNASPIEGYRITKGHSRYGSTQTLTNFYELAITDNDPDGLQNQVFTPPPLLSVYRETHNDPPYLEIDVQNSEGASPWKEKTWQHVAITRTDQVYNIYVDGEQVGTDSSEFDEFEFAATPTSAPIENSWLVFADRVEISILDINSTDLTSNFAKFKNRFLAETLDFYVDDVFVVSGVVDSFTSDLVKGTLTTVGNTAEAALLLETGVLKIVSPGFKQPLNSIGASWYNFDGWRDFRTSTFNGFINNLRSTKASRYGNGATISPDQLFDGATRIPDSEDTNTLVPALSNIQLQVSGQVDGSGNLLDISQNNHTLTARDSSSNIPGTINRWSACTGHTTRSAGYDGNETGSVDFDYTAHLGIIDPGATESLGRWAFYDVHSVGFDTPRSPDSYYVILNLEIRSDTDGPFSSVISNPLIESLDFDKPGCIWVKFEQAPNTWIRFDYTKIEKSSKFRYYRTPSPNYVVTSVSEDPYVTYSFWEKIDGEHNYDRWRNAVYDETGVWEEFPNTDSYIDVTLTNPITTPASGSITPITLTNHPQGTVPALKIEPGHWLEIQSPVADLIFNEEPFTIEYWIYVDQHPEAITPGNAGFFPMDVTANPELAPRLYVDWDEPSNARYCGSALGRWDAKNEISTDQNPLAPTYYDGFEREDALDMMAYWGPVKGRSFTISDVFATFGSNIKRKQWYHIAYTRDTNGEIRLFVNGKITGDPHFSASYVEKQTDTVNSRKLNGIKNFTQPLNTINTAWLNNVNPNELRGLDGYISDLVVVKGEAIYVEDFEVPSAPSYERNRPNEGVMVTSNNVPTYKIEAQVPGIGEPPGSGPVFTDPGVTIITQQLYSSGTTFTLTLNPSQRYTNSLSQPEFNILLYASTGDGVAFTGPQVTDGAGNNIGTWTEIGSGSVTVNVWQYKGDIIPDGSGNYTLNWDAGDVGLVPINWGLHRGTEFDWDTRSKPPGGFYDGVNASSWATLASGEFLTTDNFGGTGPRVRTCPTPAQAPWQEYFGPEEQTTNIMAVDLALDADCFQVNGVDLPLANPAGGSYRLTRFNMSEEPMSTNVPDVNRATNITCYYGYQRPWTVVEANQSSGGTQDAFQYDMKNGSRCFSFSNNGDFSTNQNYVHPTFGPWPMDALSNFHLKAQWQGFPFDSIGLHKWNWAEINGNGNVDFHGTTVPSNQDHIWYVNWSIPKIVQADLPDGGGLAGNAGKPSSGRPFTSIRDWADTDLDSYFSNTPLVEDTVGLQQFVSSGRAWRSVDWYSDPWPRAATIGYGIPPNTAASAAVGAEFDNYQYWHRVTVSFTKTYAVDGHVTGSTGDGSNCIAEDYTGVVNFFKDCASYGGDPPAIFGIGRNDCSLRVACDGAYISRGINNPLPQQIEVFDFNNYRTSSSPFDCNWLAPDDGNIRTESFWIHPYTIELQDYGTISDQDQKRSPCFSFISDGGGGSSARRSGVGITAATYQISPKIKFWGMMLHNGDITAGGSNTNVITDKNGNSLPATGYRSMSYLDSDLAEAVTDGFIVTGTNTTGTFSLSSTLDSAGIYDCLTGPNPCYDNFSYWDAPFRPRGNAVDPGTNAASTYNPRAGDICRLRIKANQGIYSGGASVQGSGATLRISKIGYMDKDTGAVTYQSLNTTDSPSWTPNGSVEEVDFLFSALGTSVFNSSMWGQIGLFELEYSGSATNGVIIEAASMEYVNDSYTSRGTATAADINVTCFTFNSELIDTDQIISEGISSTLSTTTPTTISAKSGVQTNWVVNEVGTNQTTAVIPAPAGDNTQEFFLSFVAHPGTLDDPAMGSIATPQELQETILAPFGKTGILLADRDSEVVMQFAYGYRDSVNPVLSQAISLPSAKPYLSSTISYNYLNTSENVYFATWFDLMVAEDMFHPDLVDDPQWRFYLSQAYDAACNVSGTSRIAYYAGLKTPYGNRLMNGQMKDSFLTKNYRWTDPTFDNAVDRTIDYTIQHKKDDGNFYDADFEWRPGPIGGPGNRFSRFHALGDGSDSVQTRTNLETDMFLEMGRNPNAGEDPNQGNQYWLNNFYIPDGKYSITNNRVDIWENGNTDYSLVYGLKGNPTMGAFIQNKPKGLFNTAPYFNSWSNIGFDGNKVYPTYTINGHEMFYEHRYGVDGILPQWEADLGSEFQYFHSAFLTEYGGRSYSRGGSGTQFFKTINLKGPFTDRLDKNGSSAYIDDAGTIMNGNTCGAWEFNHAENIECLFGREVTSYGWSPGIWSPTFYGSNVGNLTRDYTLKGQYQGRSRSTFTGTTIRFDLGLNTTNQNNDPEGANEMPWDSAYLNKRMVQWISGSGKNTNAIYMAHHGIGWIERPYVIHQSDSTFLRGGINGHPDYGWSFATDDQAFCNGPFNQLFSSSWWNDERHALVNNGFQGISRSDWPLGCIAQLRTEGTKIGGNVQWENNRYFVSPRNWTAGNPSQPNHIGYYQVGDQQQAAFQGGQFLAGHQMLQQPCNWRWRYAQLQVNGVNTGQISSTLPLQFGNPRPQWANMWGNINVDEPDTILTFRTIQGLKTSLWNSGTTGLRDDTMNRRILSDFSSGGLDDAPGETFDTDPDNLDTTTVNRMSSANTMAGKRLGWNSRGMSMSFNSILKAGRDEVHEPRYSSARIFALDAAISWDDDDYSLNMTNTLFTNRWVNGDLTTAHLNLFNYLKTKFANYDPIQED